ncbi:MAG: ABC transporter permease subunit [Deltaproteobacteria bacterium]|jgi:NitT/TauT family transport system permease protein|nr:ABC transporter permease subunit [Deltaproteobacteria bacterium]
MPIIRAIHRPATDVAPNDKAEANLRRDLSSSSDKSRLFGLVSCLVIVAFLFGLYGLATDVLKLPNAILFPGWEKIVPAFSVSFRQLIEGLLSSLSLLVPAVTLSILTGVSAGVFIGLNPKVEAVLLPFIRAMNPLPSTMLIPYAIAVMPTFYSSSLAIIYIGVLWPVLMNTLHGVAMLEPRWIDNARCLNLKGRQLVFKVVLPGAMPQIFAGVNAGLIRSFLLLTVAEMIGSKAGLGFFVQYYADFAKYDRVIVGMIWLSFIVVLIMTFFDLLKKRVLHWTKKR